ncbi:XrtY-associated glycosyltransferase XYAG1 [Mucilaginibacter flavidus]|uniref:XrtY-associated glycosyltransferase XYAG1 n=1 Tax=Mucilaginibacter flavidus TaxID=2949309 RepID=UPI00209229F1|nr:glycosyltransferase [Mucilaginibacter flavidus]MCO5947689.1 glycosyltransferase [Mucilaginibacter flavidus]
MKVLQICAAYKPAYIYGGPTMSVAMLSEHLAKSGIYTEVYATTANGKEELPVEPGKPVIVDGVMVTYFKRLTKDHSHFSPALFKKLSREARGFDVIHIHAWWNLVSLFACAIAVIRKVPVVISPRGTLSIYSFNNKNTGKKSFVHYMIGRRLLNSCHIHVTSAYEAVAITDIVKPKTITNLPNFVKLPLKPTAVQVDPSIFRLIFFSRIEQKKGLDILLNALPGVDFPYTLTIAGDGDTNYIHTLKALADKNRVAANINWIGFRGDEKFRLLAGHDLLVLPSHDENFGNVVIESLSEGTAVLTTPRVGLAGYIITNNFGWVCEPDAESLGIMINTIYPNKEKLGIIRSTGPRIIRKDFDENKLVQRYTEMYNKIING